MLKREDMSILNNYVGYKLVQSKTSNKIEQLITFYPLNISYIKFVDMQKQRKTTNHSLSPQYIIIYEIGCDAKSKKKRFLDQKMKSVHEEKLIMKT